MPIQMSPARLAGSLFGLPLLGLPLLVVLAGGCSSPDWGRVSKLSQPKDRPAPLLLAHSRNRIDPDTGQIQAKWAVREGEDGEVVKHGREETFWPDGSLRGVRFFEDGEGVGTWQSFWPDGSLRSEYEFAQEAQLTRMRFFHEGGLLEGEGMAANGERSGPWSFWYPNGNLAARGEYLGGRKQGVWIEYDEQGRWARQVRYEAGQRVEVGGSSSSSADPLGAR